MDFANALEPDKRKLLDDHMATMWQTASDGKKRKKQVPTGPEDKLAAEELEVAGRLFAAAAAAALKTDIKTAAEAASQAARKEKAKTDKSKGKAGDKPPSV